VILRVVVGWHFYREGTKKITYNPTTGERHVASAEPFLRLAVGPAADIIREQLPNAYDWERYLAVPRQIRQASQEDLEKQQKWESDYAAKRKAAQQRKEPQPVEFPPFSPYYEWADRIDAGWRDALAKFGAIGGVTDDQKKEADARLLFRRQQLADYLAEQSDAISEWEHELWRLSEWEKDKGADDLPFLGSRINEKRAETKAASAPWIAAVQDIDFDYRSDLRGLLTAEQVKNKPLVEAVDAALVDEHELKLQRVSFAAACVIIGTGVCLMLGLLTRLAAMAGIGFLLTVLATQPPWIPGAVTAVLYYQLVEIAALLVLFMSGAGRWAGLDYFFRAFVRRRRAVAES
jgi:uncharacterized membrane protein YphA (DoxX/SURF4 family)